MRFRANTSLLPWLLVGFACVVAFDVLRSRSVYPFSWMSFVSGLILSVALFIFSHFLTYWELDSSCLRERKLWKKKEIAWHEVTRISWLGFSSDKVKISYGRVPEDYAYIIANPSSLNKFLSSLRQFVPEAYFDISPKPASTCKGVWRRSDQ